MNREVLDGWCERGILGLVLGILVFGPLATGGVLPVQFIIMEGMTAGVMVLWLARLWILPRPKTLWPPICWAVIAFVLYATGRYLACDIEYVAREEIIQILVYAFLFLAILNNAHRQETTQIISFTLIFLAMGIAFYACYQFVTGSEKVWQFAKPYLRRGSGTYFSPNHLAGFLEMLLPLGLAYTLAGRMKPVTRILLGYATLVILAGLAATMSRGSWIASAVALVLLLIALLTHHRHRVPALVAFFLLLGVGCFYLPKSFFIQMRVQNTVDAQGQLNDQSRFAVWRPTVQVWQDEPLWGTGPGHFDYRFRAHRPEGMQLRPRWAHNDYLNTLADYGAAGMALVLAALALLGSGLAKTWPAVRRSATALGKHSGNNKFAFVTGATAGLAAILIHSAGDFNMHIPANAALAVALMALLSSHLRFATDRYWSSLAPWSKSALSIVLAAGVVCLGMHGWRWAWETHWLEQARKLPPFSSEQVARLTRAFSVEPKNAETAYAIGEALRRQSSAGVETATAAANQALTWFERSIKLNPWESHAYLGCGLTLDWLDRSNEAGPYFDKADSVDPNGYYTMAHIGLHYMNLRQYAAAKPWLERSLKLQHIDNPIARSYLDLANIRLLEAATNQLSARLQQASPR